MNKYPEIILEPTLQGLEEKGVLERVTDSQKQPGGTPQGWVRVTETGEGVYREIWPGYKKARCAARKAPEGWTRNQ